MNPRIASWHHRIMIGQLPRHAKPICLVHGWGDAPPRFLEYAYYFSIFYAIFGDALGLSVGLLGAGMLAVMAAFCTIRLGSRAITVYKPIVFPLGCAFSSVALQVFLHGESLMSGYTREFVPWMLGLIIVQSLSLNQGFLHRFALAAFGIGLMTLPYLTFWGGGAGVQRAALDQTVGYSNPNDLAAWFGFCSVYFIVLGIQTKRNVVRIGAWLVAIGCLYIVGLTVSRGKLLAVAIATVIALRHLLKQSFIPVLMMIILGWVIYESGLFEQVTAFYATRGTEETGRFPVWRLALERFLSSPLVGVGGSNIGTDVPTFEHPIEPHNGFLLIALASGIVPLTFFVAYWVHAAWGAFRSNAERLPDAPFRIPLFVYALLVAFVGNASFMFPWMIVTHSTAITAATRQRVRRVLVRQIGRGRTAGYSGRLGETGYRTARYQFYNRPRNF